MRLAARPEFGDGKALKMADGALGRVPSLAALPGLGGAQPQLDPALQRALASMVESNADQFSEMSGLSVLRNRIHDHAQQRVERLREHGRHYRGPHSTTRTPPPAPSFSRPGAIGRNPASFGLPPPAFQPRVAADGVGSRRRRRAAAGRAGHAAAGSLWRRRRDEAAAALGVAALRSWRAQRRARAAAAELACRRVQSPSSEAALRTLPHARRPPGPRSEL